MGKAITGRGVGAPDFVQELRPTIYEVVSDKDIHFTGEIAKNGVERENIPGLRTNRVRISKISIQSDQRLFYEVLIYGSSDFEEANLEDDYFVASVELNLPIYAAQQVTDQWKLDIEGINIDYVDLNRTKQIHVVLKNLSPTSKNQGTSGEVKLSFLCEARA
ncbi:hypothetical protein ES703_65216 [subsurface metagenome]